MKQYLKYLSPTQSQPIPGQNMVKNNAGGYSYEISDQERLERFLILGSDSGTYYVSEQKLTAENANFVIEYIKKEPVKVAKTIVLFSQCHRAPKHETILFVYALTMTFGDAQAIKYCYDHLNDICFTPTHLFSLLTCLKPLRGWSRGLRKAVANWYLVKQPENLAYQIVKYRARSGYTHKDVLRLCHPKTDNKKLNNVFTYIAGKDMPSIYLPDIIPAYEFAQKCNEEELCELIRNAKLTWEMIPTTMLNKSAVLEALLPSMPLTALMRNLNRYTYANTLATTKDTICARLTDKDKILASNIHPINVINTFCTYGQGHGDKGNKSWTPDQSIMDALHTMYELSMATVTPTGKNILVGIDISGSMSSNKVGSYQMTPAQISAILAHTMIKTEQNVEVILFDTVVRPYPFGKRSSIDEILRGLPTGGGTNCGLPIAYACQNRKPYDAIIILTDSETWAGDQHASQALAVQRRNAGKRTKVIEIALVANPFTNFPPDKDILRIVGFDASVITVLQDFLGR